MDNDVIEKGLAALGLTDPTQRMSLKLFLSPRHLPAAGQLQATKDDWHYELTSLGLTYQQTDRLLAALLDPKPAAPAPQRQYDPYRMSPDPQSQEAMSYYYPGHQALPFVRK